MSEMHGQPCEVKKCRKPGEVHHIISRARGGPDLPWNLMALCPLHHIGEWHGKGVGYMLESYPELNKNLSDRGFNWDPQFKKLWPPAWWRLEKAGR